MGVREGGGCRGHGEELLAGVEKQEADSSFSRQATF